MTGRREFLSGGLATGALTVAGGMPALAKAPPKTVDAAPVVPRAETRVRGMIRREETVLRMGGVGDNWHMTWAEDDRQYVSLCDGFGWPGMPGYDQQNSEINSRLYAIEGDPPNARFVYLPGYPDYRQPVTPLGRIGSKCSYYCFATIALDGRIYQYLSTLNGTRHNDGSDWPGQRFIGAKLIWSPDRGQTWYNQDGTTPVRWEDLHERTKDNMVFFEEEDFAFSLLTALQMGKAYEHNRDGYVYLYAPNGTTEGTMNQLVMCRVRRDRVLDRRAYEFFAGRRANGEASWSPDIARRAVVHSFPTGWVNNDVSAHPYAWHPSVAYNAPLGLYMMANWGMGIDDKRDWFMKPSYLGFWTAKTPWGPWEQVYEEQAWTPANSASARAYQPQIAPRWIAPDGKSFWLVWTDIGGGSPPYKPDTAFNAVTKSRSIPYYAFNAQRVDIIV